jgi:hypothetical protein
MTTMTTKERLALMEEIKRKNDAAWKKYAKQSRPGWTWDMNVKRQFRPSDSFGAKCVLAVCLPALLALFLKLV